MFSLVAFFQTFPVELSAWQVIVVGQVVSVLIFLFKKIAEANGYKPNLQVIGVVSIVVSILMAFLFTGVGYLPKLPEDLAGKVNTLLTWLVEFMGFATLFYNIIFKKLLEWVSTTLTTAFSK